MHWDSFEKTLESSRGILLSNGIFVQIRLLPFALDAWIQVRGSARSWGSIVVSKLAQASIPDLRAGMLTRPQPHEAEAEAEATTHEAEAEATTHEAEAEAEATTHEAEAEAEAEAKTHLEILIIII